MFGLMVDELFCGEAFSMGTEDRGEAPKAFTFKIVHTDTSTSTSTP
jgi:hypothetical protein